MYTNTSTPQVIYVRVTNDITQCYTIVNFTIIVNPLPDVIAVTDFIACELNNDGFYDFDLTTERCRSVKWTRSYTIYSNLSCESTRCRRFNECACESIYQCD